MQFFPPGTQLPNSEETMKFILVVITVGFGFFNMTNLRNIPILWVRLGALRNHETGNTLFHNPLSVTVMGTQPFCLNAC